jgi:2-amino-4-hydroxy-6-hydroxymethyldihydropteridine diphosphokinase
MSPARAPRPRRPALVPVALALGSNLSDRRRHLESAIEALRASGLTDVRASRFIETEADPPGIGPAFLNAALIARTALAPRALLDVMLAIERTHGRERPYVNAPRTLDLDLILYGDLVLDEEGLTIPHPRFRERRFVLDPLVEIAADWKDPVSGYSVKDLHARLHPSSSGVC